MGLELDARINLRLLDPLHPHRMGQVLMVDAPWIFQPSWAVIKPL
jgi:hypothetical protein